MPDRLTPDGEARKKRVQQDVERAAKLGQTLAAQEKERKEARADSSEREQVVAHEILEKDQEKIQKKKREAKQFRVTKKQRDTEIEADVARRAAEAEKIRKEQAEQKAEQEERRRYMQELNLQAALKKKKLDRENAIAKEKKSIRARAELHYREVADAAARARRDAGAQLERITRERFTVVDAELKKSLYSLEQASRSRMATLSADATRLQSSRSSPSPAAQSQQEAGLRQLKLKQKKLEDDLADEKLRLTQEANLKKVTIQNEARDSRTAIERQFREAMSTANSQRSQELGTIGKVGTSDELPTS